MYNGKTVSLKQIMWRVANHPLMRDINYEDAAMYALEAIRLIGAPLMYTNALTKPPVNINDHKGRLPSDLIEIRGIKDADTNFVYKYASDIYHGDFCKEDFGDCQYNKDYTYTISNGVITTSIKKGQVIISYKKIETDEEGYPLIPDNIKVLNAIRYYIMYSHLEPLNDIGKVSDKAFNRIEQNYLWYVGGANTSMQLANLDHLETTMNAVNRLLINNSAHERGFRFLQEKEGNTKYKS